MHVVSLEAEQELFVPDSGEAQRARPLEVPAGGAGMKSFHGQPGVLDESLRGMPRPRRVNGTTWIENSKWAVLLFGFPG
jgi:hypothetical protein